MLDYALRQAIAGREEEVGFQLERRQSRRKGHVVVTDLDFADNIALLSELINQDQDLLNRVETSAAQIGLVMNAMKTRIMTTDGTQLEVAEDFKYLDSWIDNSEKDFKARKAEAWRACNKLTKIWKSDLNQRDKDQSILQHSGISTSLWKLYSLSQKFRTFK